MRAPDPVALISPPDAEAAVRAGTTRLPAVSVPLLWLAGRVLREDIAAARDQPPFNRVMMDGIGISVAAWASGRRAFRIAGTQPAGAAPLTLGIEHECIEVMTGAVLPAGCDCVIPVEKIGVDQGVAQLAEDVMPSALMNVHVRGIDVRRGDLLLSEGTVLGPAEVAVLAANGHTHAHVTRSPRIVVISTGDELVEPGTTPAPWQIFRSNVFGVLAALRARGFDELTHDHVPDDVPALRARLREHLESHDVLILSGGVSMGRFDYIPQVLVELGVRVVFHKIAQRPGKPMWFGVGAQGQTVYALPGNPVSTLVCLLRYALPGLTSALGAAPAPTETIALAEDFEVKPALTLFVPVKITNAAGQRHAHPRPTRGSGDFTSLVGTDGFVELRPGPGLVAHGTVAPFYRW